MRAQASPAAQFLRPELCDTVLPANMNEACLERSRKVTNWVMTPRLNGLAFALASRAPSHARARWSVTFVNFGASGIGGHGSKSRDVDRHRPWAVGGRPPAS